MIRTLSAVIVAVLIAFTTIGTAKALTVEQVVKKAKSATVFIVVATNNGAQSGSGFAVQSNADSTTIVTANHVVEGGTQVDVIFDGSEKKRYPAEVIRRDHVKDVAILKVHVGHRPFLSLESPDDVSEGMQIVLIGYPLATLEFHRVQGDALQPSVHTGIISAIRFNGAVLQFDAATYHGDSGGPIIDTDNGRVVAIVHGAELDPSYAARGLEQTLPGSSFGPSSSTIASVIYQTGTGNSPSISAQGEESSGSGPASNVAAAGTSSSYRVGYGIPHEVVTSGDPQFGNGINAAVESAAIDRLQEFLKQDNSLYLISVSPDASAMSDSQRLSGYCDDARLNALVLPSYSWGLTGGPRYNGYGHLMGYSGEATATVALFVFDCYGVPFFTEQKSKSENRYFAHRTPDREIVDMTNDLLSQLMSDFAAWRSQYAGAWQSLLKTGLAIDPTDGRLHSMLYFAKKPEGYQVISVAPNGPADRAGVKVQDIIEQVNGRDTDGMNISEIVGLMNASSYTLVLQRPGGNVTVTVHPEPYDQLVKELQH